MTVLGMLITCLSAMICNFRRTSISTFVFLYFLIWICIESVLHFTATHPGTTGSEEHILPYLFINCLYQLFALGFLELTCHSKLSVIAIGSLLLYFFINLVTEFFGIQTLSYYIYPVTAIAWVALLSEGFRGDRVIRADNAVASNIRDKQRSNTSHANVK